MNDNRSAGIPDYRWNDGTTAWAWEIKYSDGDAVPLGQPDVHGLQVDAPSGQAHPRLVALDIAFPARPWVLDATHLCIGELVPDAHAHLHQPEEAM